MVCLGVFGAQPSDQLLRGSWVLCAFYMAVELTAFDLQEVVAGCGWDNNFTHPCILP